MGRADDLRRTNAEYDRAQAEAKERNAKEAEVRKRADEKKRVRQQEADKIVEEKRKREEKERKCAEDKKREDSLKQMCAEEAAELEEYRSSGHAALEARIDALFDACITRITEVAQKYPEVREIWASFYLHAETYWLHWPEKTHRTHHQIGAPDEFNNKTVLKQLVLLGLAERLREERFIVETGYQEVRRSDFHGHRWPEFIPIDITNAVDEYVRGIDPGYHLLMRHGGIGMTISWR